LLGVAIAATMTAGSMGCVRRRPTGVAEPSVASTGFDPLVRRVGFGERPSGYGQVGYAADRAEQKVTIARSDGSGPMAITVRADGGSDTHSSWFEATSAQRVRGRPTLWTRQHGGGLHSPYLELDWEYIDGAWASLDAWGPDQPPALDSAVSAATGVVFGLAEPVRLPVRLSDLPGGLRVERVDVWVLAGSGPEVNVRVALRGVDHDGRLEVGIRTPDTYPGTGGDPRYTTVDGRPAFHHIQGPDRYHDELSVWGVNGMQVNLDVYGAADERRQFAPDGAIGLLRELTVIPDPSRWV
jgi:hypothetical protein